MRARFLVLCPPRVDSTKGGRMVTGDNRRSPSPSQVGYSLGRRDLLKGAAGVAGAAAAGLMLPGGFAAAQEGLEPGSGDLTLGSYQDNEIPKQAIHAAIDSLPNKNVTVKWNEVDHN